METYCPICEKPKKESNKFCSYQCRNVYINSRKDYGKQSEALFISVNKFYDDKLGIKTEFKVECLKCKNEFVVVEREKQFPQRDKYYCSRSCANGKEWSEENKIKRSLAWKPDDMDKDVWLDKKKRDRRRRIRKPLTSEERHAIHLDAGRKAAETRRKNGNFRTLDKKEIKDYRTLCKFVFKLKDYPDEFDLSLYQQYGTYKAKNYGNNQNGIVRDHMYSIKKGFENNVDPYLLSHPANCNLIRGSENQSKNCKCVITIEQLKERIEKWNEKYGPYPNDRATHLQ